VQLKIALPIKSKARVMVHPGFTRMCMHAFSNGHCGWAKRVRWAGAAQSVSCTKKTEPKRESETKGKKFGEVEGEEGMSYYKWSSPKSGPPGLSTAE